MLRRDNFPKGPTSRRFHCLKLFRAFRSVGQPDALPTYVIGSYRNITRRYEATFTRNDIKIYRSFY